MTPIQSDSIWLSGFLITLSLLGLYGFGRILHAPRYSSIFVGGSCAALLTTISIYTMSNLSKIIMIVIVSIGIIRCTLHAIDYFERQRFRPHQILTFLILLLTVVFVLNEHFPLKLFKIENNILFSRFYNLDILFRSSLAREILESDSWGPMISPFGYPYQFAGYHATAEAFLSSMMVFLPHPNVVSYSLALWILLVFSMILAIFWVTSFFPSGAYFFIAACATMITFSSLDGFGSYYGPFEYFAYNSSSFFGYLCILLSLMTFQRDKKWALFFMLLAPFYKISLAPPCYICSLFLVFYSKIYRDPDLKFRDLYVLIIPVGGLAIVILSAIFFPNIEQHSIGIRNIYSIPESLHRLESWILPVYKILIKLFSVEGSKTNILLSLIAVSTFLMLPSFFIKSTREIFYLNLTIWIVSFVVLIMIKTDSVLQKNNIDPWVTSFSILLPILAQLFVISFVSAIKNISEDKIPYIKPFVLAIFAIGVLYYVKPIRYGRAWQKVELNKNYNQEVLKTNQPIIAAFMGYKIDANAKNRYQFRTNKKLND